MNPEQLKGPDTLEQGADKSKLTPEALDGILKDPKATKEFTDTLKTPDKINELKGIISGPLEKALSSDGLPEDHKKTLLELKKAFEGNNKKGLEQQTNGESGPNASGKVDSSNATADQRQEATDSNKPKKGNKEELGGEGLGLGAGPNNPTGGEENADGNAGANIIGENTSEGDNNPKGEGSSGEELPEGDNNPGGGEEKPEVAEGGESKIEVSDGGTGETGQNLGGNTTEEDPSNPVTIGQSDETVQQYGVNADSNSGDLGKGQVANVYESADVYNA